MTCKHKWVQVEDNIFECDICEKRLKQEGVNKWVEVEKPKKVEEKEPPKEELTYTDDDGKKMFGYSQMDLDRLNDNINTNTHEVKALRNAVNTWKVIVFGLGIIGIGYVFWLTWYVIHFGIFNNALKILGGG